MAQLPFVVEEDVWIDHRTGKPIREEEAVNGAQRINAGERISNEDAERYGLKKRTASEDKAVKSAPENKGGDALGHGVPADEAPAAKPVRKTTARKTIRK